MNACCPPPVSVVVPTLNAAAFLDGCLRSIREQDVPCEVIVVDRWSTDATPDIARQYADSVLMAGPERSRQRNLGAAVSRADVVAFVDADMYLTAGVLGEALDLIESGAGAVVVPERSVGHGFVARVRAFERSFYAEGTAVEAARVFRREVFDAVGGYDETLTGPEDWDLHLRVSRLGTVVGRTRSCILHDEGHPTFRSAWHKKAYYASGLRTFVRRYRGESLGVLTDRPWLRRPWRLLFPHPVLGMGLLLLKGGEAVAVAIALTHTGADEPQGTAHGS